MSDPRAEELLIERAVRGLDDRELQELDQRGAAGDESYDAAAAAVTIAVTPLEQMPAHLAAKILADAGAGTGAMADDYKRTLTGVQMPAVSGLRPQASGLRSQIQSAGVTGEMPTRPVVDAPIPIERARAKRSRSATIAWSAAAACMLIAGGVVWWATGRAKGGAQVAVKSPVDARAELLASAKDATTIAWTATADPAAHGASGDVVWSASQQRGYMRFTGLAVNDPTKSQYQLWIFDKDRDQAFPVDGGVFDVSSTGEVIVPITAKLHVDDPTLFAVTVERPGGVVVSKRERIVVTAARG